MTTVLAINYQAFRRPLHLLNHKCDTSSHWPSSHSCHSLSLVVKLSISSNIKFTHWTSSLLQELTYIHISQCTHVCTFMSTTHIFKSRPQWPSIDMTSIEWPSNDMTIVIHPITVNHLLPSRPCPIHQARTTRFVSTRYVFRHHLHIPRIITYDDDAHLS